MELDLRTVKPELTEILTSLCNISELRTFRLVGGTAIALQLGHRKSIDIDFFSTARIDKAVLRKVLGSVFTKSIINVTEHYISFEDKGVRVDIYDDWGMPFLQPEVNLQGVRIAALRDLAAWKLSAITGRREKKDYIDLYFLFQQFEPLQVLDDFTLYDPLLSSKSLLFALSEASAARDNRSPMPEMLTSVVWDAIVSRFEEIAAQYAKTLRRGKPD